MIFYKNFPFIKILFVFLTLINWLIVYKTLKFINLIIMSPVSSSSSKSKVPARKKAPQVPAPQTKSGGGGGFLSTIAQGFAFGTGEEEIED